MSINQLLNFNFDIQIDLFLEGLKLMKILLINGSPRKKGACMRALEEIKEVLTGSGLEISEYWVGKAPRHACSGCGGCKGGDGCVYRDIDGLIELSKEADGIVICTPTHYASAPGNLTSILSRLVFSSRVAVEFKPIGVMGVGRRGGICEAVRDVKKFFEFTSCPIVSGIYPPILYAKNYKSAALDDEGLENARSLASNIAYIARCLRVGAENGIFPPHEERRFKTDITDLKTQSSAND